MTSGIRALRVAAPLVVAAVAFALARRTLLPGLGFWDTGEFQAVGPVLGTAHPTGFPSYVVLGWLASVVLAPFGEPALRMNLLSALLIASAAALTVVLVRILTGWTALAIAAGLGLAATPIAWRIASHADPHALHVALVALLVVCLAAWEREHRHDEGDRWLVAASAVYGLSLANHSLTLLLAPAVGLYVLAVDRHVVRRGRLVAACALAVIGSAALFYLELPLRAGIFRAPLVYGRPDTWDGFRYIVTAEQFQGSIVDPFGDLAIKFRDLVDLTAAQFGIVAPLLPIAFVVTAGRLPRYALLSGLAVAITCFFAASYVNADITRYYLGPLLFAWTWLAVLCGAAVEWLAGTLAPPAGAVAGAGAPRGADEPPRRGPLAGAVAATVAVALVIPTLLALPARARVVDESSDVEARRWVEDVVAALPPDAIVVTWWAYSTPLWYVQRVEHRRPDITIVDDRTRLDEQLGEISDVIDAHLGRQPVYLVLREDGTMPLLLRRYAMEPIPGAEKRLLRVTGPAGSP